MFKIECPICLDNDIAGAWVCTKACGHLFHSPCIQPITDRPRGFSGARALCPVCRTDISTPGACVTLHGLEPVGPADDPDLASARLQSLQDEVTRLQNKVAGHAIQLQDVGSRHATQLQNVRARHTAELREEAARRISQLQSSADDAAARSALIQTLEQKAASLQFQLEQAAAQGAGLRTSMTEAETQAAARESNLRTRLATAQAAGARATQLQESFTKSLVEAVRRVSDLRSQLAERRTREIALRAREAKLRLDLADSRRQTETLEKVRDDARACAQDLKRTAATFRHNLQAAMNNLAAAVDASTTSSNGTEATSPQIHPIQGVDTSGVILTHPGVLADGARRDVLQPTVASGLNLTRARSPDPKRRKLTQAT